jgi:phosphatidylglycerophosphatase A
MRKLIIIVATALGAGYSPVASGTAGSALAAIVFWFLFPDNALFMLGAAVIATALSVYTGGKAEKYFDSRDDSRIVIDEVAGYFISVLFLPKTLFFAIAAFLLFRLFDVIKPFFIKKVQDWPGGWGVTFDDVFAGIFANLILQVVHYAFLK